MLRKAKLFAFSAFSCFCFSSIVLADSFDIYGKTGKHLIYLEQFKCSHQSSSCNFIDVLIKNFANNFSLTSGLQVVTDIVDIASVSGVNVSGFNDYSIDEQNILLKALDIRYRFYGAIQVNEDDSLSIFYVIQDLTSNKIVLYSAGEVVENNKNAIVAWSNELSNRFIKASLGYEAYFGKSYILHIAGCDVKNASRVHALSKKRYVNKTMYLRNLQIVDRAGRSFKSDGNVISASMPSYVNDNIVYSDILHGSPKIKICNFIDLFSTKICRSTYDYFLNLDDKVLSPRVHMSNITFVSIDEDNLMTPYAFDYSTSNIVYSGDKLNYTILSYHHISDDMSIYECIKDGIAKICKSYSWIFGRHEVTLGDRNAAYSEPSLSPDGKSVAFVKSVNGVRNLGIMDIDGNNERLLFNSYRINRPSWSPNGYEIVFSFQEGKNKLHNLGIVDIFGNVINIIRHERCSLLEPYWFLYNDVFNLSSELN